MKYEKNNGRESWFYMNTKTRIRYIDIAKCIAMVLVIHNHWMADYHNSLIKIFIASFHMPAFFLLSGLTIKTPNSRRELMGHIFKRIKIIMLPFYLWSFCFVGFGAKRLIMLLYGSNLSISSIGGIGGSWFIPCFFVADIITCLVLYFCKNNKKGLLTFTGLLLTVSYLLNKLHLTYGFPFSLDVACLGAGFICIGHLLSEFNTFAYIEKSKSFIKFLIFSLSIGLTLFLPFTNKAACLNSYGRPVMALGYYGNLLLFILGGIAGSLMIIILSIYIQNTLLGKKIEPIGRNTFTILMLQQSVINLIEGIIIGIGVSLNFVIPIILSIICLFACDCISKVITCVYPNLKGVAVLKRAE